MSFLIQMPKLGHTMTEGTVLKWHKRAGDNVREGEAVLTVETDKAEIEIESPAAGVLARVLADEGVVVGVGLPLGEIVREGETASDLTASVVEAPAKTASSNSGAAVSSPQKAASAAGAKRVIASPRAKRIAAERGIDLSSVAGSGPDGMITEDDVRKIGEKKIAEQPTAQMPASTPGFATEGLAPSRREKLTRIQMVGARNVTSSWKEIPHFVQMVRIDMKRALEARQSINAAGSRVSVTDVILSATVLALKENPRINASYSDGERLIYDQINLGIAVDTPDGLVVPVIHDAGALDIKGISARAAELAERARNKRLRPADIENATFTVSNLGAYGIENGTPVIFAPQSALMFVGAIHDEVLAIEGRAEVRPAMQIAIAYDHRGLDGANASRFTTRVKALLEAPDFLGAVANTKTAAPERHREVRIEAVGESLKTEVRYGGLRWPLSAEDASAPDPVSSFLGALGSCLLMSLRVAARARKMQVGRTSVQARSNEKGHVKEIQVELQVETAIDDEQLHRLVEVAERGCHIRALIRDEVAFSLQVARI
ncbi:MAG: 2-oxo acid dehydrogenase subunit E2 [Candidatus Binatus sp.]|uniref:2-oxo acid dehydrogenase subunit E2 n=1 Tax=Candidatus Binatus sp. TaxID=2811406 RepID=UPI002728512A|nr:2-oxo acid dehydrogenase subunit E2 [Candidatus Binatus sp.]MDO8433540.1 2-oxo acid dehydrogenase subunit E2 [Candidatus Binatus sp.]